MWWLLLAFASAVTPPDWSGRPVAQVSLVWPEGSSADDNLQPLLLSHQDSPANPGDVRRDVATLFRVGGFRAVEVDAQGAPYETDDGDIIAGVVLTYRVFPAPKVADVVLGPTRGVPRSRILDATRVSIGQPYYAELDARPAAERIEALYADAGYPNAQARLVEVEDEGRLTVFVDVDAGTPQLATEVLFTGELPVPESRLRRWARQSGVAQGKPVSADAVSDAQFRIRQELSRLRTFPVQRGGWVGARVTPALVLDDDGQARVAFTIEPGRRLRVRTEGLTSRGTAKVLAALGIDERTRLTRGFVAAAPERIETSLQDAGFLRASVVVSLEPLDDRTQVLTATIDRGPRHILKSVDFAGNEAVADSTLRAVMDQESPDLIRLRRVTTDALEDTLPAMEQVYRARGYLDVQTQLDDLQTRVRRGPIARFRSRPPVLVTANVSVTEGNLTTLRDIAVEGAADIVPIGDVQARAAALVGGPYSPQALAQIAQSAVQAHRDRGFLQADARIVPVGEGAERAATIAITPGPQVLLRSIVLRGASRTRPQTLRREANLPLGEPVTAGSLEAMRRDLYDLGSFRTVTTDLLGDGSLRDLVVSVEEQPRWAFELGGGVSTDQGLRSFGRATRRNLWGRAHRVSLYGLLGIDWRSDALGDWTPDITDPEWRAAITYQAPHFPFLTQSVLVDVLLRERVQERTWEMSRSGVGFAVDTDLGARTTLRTALRVETRTLQEVDVGALLDGEPWTALLDSDTPTLPSPFRVQDAMTALLFYDQRDSQFAPSRGFSLSLQGEIAPGLPWSTGPKRPAAFARSQLRGTGYVPVGRFTVRATGDIGAVAMLSDGILALEDRYRLGGTGNLRGFRRDTLGPRNRVRNPDLGWSDRLDPIIGATSQVDPDRWVPTGGDARVLASLEFIAPLPALGLYAWDGYAAALFIDAGNVWLITDGVDATSEGDAVTDIFNPFLRYSAGAGLRVATPVGPLQVDLAANPAVITATGLRRELLVEQWREPALRAHISLGTLF